MNGSRKSRVESRGPAHSQVSALDLRLSTLNQTLSAVILAGGKSSRMGCDKAWLKIDGQSLLARQIQLVREIGAEEVFISGRADRNYAEFGLPVLPDGFPAAGPLAGIERALAAGSSPRLLVVAVDMPNLSAAILRRLAGNGAGRTGVIPRIDGRIEPLAAIYPKAAADLAATLLNNGFYAATTFAEQCVRSGRADFQDLDRHAAHYFASWNTPADVRPDVARQPSFCPG